MKKLSFLFLSALFCCLQASAVRTILCGHFNYIPKSTITVQYYATPIDNIESVHTTNTVDVDGALNFKVEMDIDNPTSINVMNGDDYLFINKFINAGDSLFIIIDTNNMSMSGKGEEGIGVMFDHEHKYFDRDGVGLRNESFKQKKPLEFGSYWIALMKDQLKFVDSEFKAIEKPKSDPSTKNKENSSLSTLNNSRHPVPATYKNAIRQEIMYDAAMSIAQFGYRGNLGDRGVLCDPEYFKFLSDIKIDNKDALVNAHYVYFLRELPYNIWQCKNNRKLFDSVVTMYNSHNQYRLRDSIAKIYFTGTTYDLALYIILNEEVNILKENKSSPKFKEGYSIMKKEINDLGGGFNDQSLLTRLNNKLKDLKAEDRPAPDFTAISKEGKKVKLSDFKGKVVYVDFWATNCAPCVAEMPDILKLQEKYKGKDVVFLYVSFDNSKATLNNFIEQRHFTGTHLSNTKGFASEAAQKYNISGIPRHILVDKKGILVSSDAPRPSGHPEEMIDAALNK